MNKYIKHIALLLILMASAFGCFAYQPPKMQCIRILNNNQIRVAWSSNPDCTHFKAYYFYVNDILCDSLLNSPNDPLIDYGGKDINNIPTASEYSSYIIATDDDNNEYASDTIHSFSITVTPNTYNTMAYLTWGPPTTSMDNTWGNTFDIYKRREFESDFPDQPSATVPNTQFQYTDTSDVCDNTIYYQVGISHYYPNGSLMTPCSFRTTIGSAHLVDSNSPAPPVLDSVTVTPTNEVMLGFHETDPYMLGFIIYYINPNGNIPLDTVYGQTFWIDPVIDPRYDTREYRIAALDSCGNGSSITTDPQCNIRLMTPTTDACHRTASLQWSGYHNLFNDINHYEVLLSGDMGQNWENIGSVTGTSFLIEDLELNHDYIAYVRVVNNGGTITASSNRVNILITAEETQDFTYIRSVSVIDNQYIQIKVLTSGDTLPFVSLTLQRSEDGVQFENFKTRNFSQGTANYVFVDSLADFSRKTYFYRAFLVNQCGVAVGQSNISHNILLQGENNAQNNLLSWHGYEFWDGGVSDYYILRRAESEELFNTAGSQEPSVVNNYFDDISALYESGSKFYYYIEAHEGMNRYGFEETSISNQITLIQPPTIYLPNAFRPLAASNNVFRPVNSFVSLDGYSFSIFTRTGECIFLTTNPQEGWDGRVKGTVAPMGVYVWYLEYKLPDGTPMERTGTVTLVK